MKNVKKKEKEILFYLGNERILKKKMKRVENSFFRSVSILILYEEHIYLLLNLKSLLSVKLEACYCYTPRKIFTAALANSFSLESEW